MKITCLLLVLIFSLTVKGQSNFVKTDEGKTMVTPTCFTQAGRDNNNFYSLSQMMTHSANCGDLDWKPKFGYYYSGDSVNAQGEIRYECDEKGVLRKMIGTYYYQADSIVVFYNGSYIIPAMNVVDTVIQYVKSGGIYSPNQRYYYNYNLSDNRGDNSYFYDYVVQVWDKNNNYWKNYSKETWHFADPKAGHILEVKRSLADAEDNFTITQSHTKDSLIYDNAGNVKWRIPLVFNGYALVEIGERNEYFYHEDGGPYYETIYYYSSQIGEQWTPNIQSIRSNIEWYYWNGFQDNFWLPFTLGDSYAYTYYHNTMSKLASYDYYGYFWWSTGEWGQTRSDKFAWDVDGTKTHIDSVYTYLEDGDYYLSQTIHNTYNQCGDYTGYVSYIWEGAPEPCIKSYSGNLYNIEYNQYGQAKNFIYLLDSEETEPSIFYTGTRITEFSPVSIAKQPQSSKKLSVFPNPASDNVQIKAEEMMQYVEIFDLTGKMVAFQPVFGNNSLLDVKRLAAGVYLIKATMKEGNIQTEKLIIQ